MEQAIFNRSRHIGTVQGSVSRAAPLVCNDMQFTDPFLVKTMAAMPWIVATFPLNGEPNVHGFGPTSDDAMRIARYAHQQVHKCALPHDAVPCRRQENHARWLSGAGQEVTLAHMSVRKEFQQ